MLEEQQEYAQDNVPEYAMYLVASMMTEEDMRQRKENEEIYRIQNVLGVKREWDRSWPKRLGEKDLSYKIDPPLRGRPTRTRIEGEMKMKRCREESEIHDGEKHKECRGTSAVTSIL
jgi:hypothetical protein